MSALLKTPLVEVRWCKLTGDARPNKFDPSKRPEWSVEIVLDNDNKGHMAWVEEMEGLYDKFHGDKRKHASWLPIKPDKEEPRKKTVARFKLPQFDRRDGGKSEGPTLFDSNKSPWPLGKEIGNGSKMIIGFDIYAWSGSTGAGLTFQPRAAQVVELVEYTAKNANPDEAFEVVNGGYVAEETPF